MGGDRDEFPTTSCTMYAVKVKQRSIGATKASPFKAHMEFRLQFSLAARREYHFL